MITKLSEVLDNYSVTDKTHGTVKFGQKKILAKKDAPNTAYAYLPAEGDAVKDLTEPHITIWGASAAVDSNIVMVEFSWAGAKHVQFHMNKKTFDTPNLPSKDQADAGKLEVLLKLFLNAATIATINIPTSTSSSSSSSPTSNSNANSNISMPGSTSYATEFPSMSSALGKKK